MYIVKSKKEDVMKKLYVVLKGKEPGIYNNWPECSAQVQGFSGAKYKSFKTTDLASAKSYMKENQMTPSEIPNKGIPEEMYQELKGIKGTKEPSEIPKKKSNRKSYDYETEEPVENYIAVDGGTEGNNSDGTSFCEFQVYSSVADDIIYASERMVGTNNIAEFLAIVKAFSILKNSNRKDIVIYTDSKVAIGWVKNKKCNTKLFANAINDDEVLKTKNAVDSAIDYLNKLEVEGHEFDLRKWNTKKWGENPADYGRK